MGLTLKGLDDWGPKGTVIYKLKIIFKTITEEKRELFFDFFIFLTLVFFLVYEILPSSCRTKRCKKEKKLISVLFAID